MLILVGVVALVFFLTLLWAHWCSDESWTFNLVMAIFAAVIAGGAVGSMAVSAARAYVQEEVDIRYSIYEGPSGRYVDNGTSGEYNDQITIWYWKDGDSLRKSWKSAGSVGVTYMDSDRSAYAFLTCPSGETLPEWLKMPWEKGNHDWEPDCTGEFVNLYIPEGES